MAATELLTPVEELTQRAAVFALFARLLGYDPAPLLDGVSLSELRAGLRALGEDDALGLLDRVDVVADLDSADADELRKAWVRWFEMGRIGPYECSNTLVSAGGHTGPLADIAGFYRAFGVKIQGERPDHLVAELEFFSLVTMAEAAARSTGADEQADVAASAARAFLRDHLGRWLDAFAARVLEVDPPLVWGPIAAAAASTVRSETRRRNVVVVQSARAFLQDDELPEEAGEPICGSDLDFIE